MAYPTEETPGVAEPEITRKPEEERIVTSSVMADMKRPFLVVTNRWNYLERFLPIWKGFIRYRLFAIVLAAVGILTLFMLPIVAVPCFGGAVYFWRRHLFFKSRLESERTVIIGH